MISVTVELGKKLVRDAEQYMPIKSADTLLRFMANRLEVGQYRYGKTGEWDPTKSTAQNYKRLRYDDEGVGFDVLSYSKAYLESRAWEKVYSYKATGNTELLVDIANYLVWLYFFHEGCENFDYLFYRTVSKFYYSYKADQWHSLDQGITDVDSSRG